MNNEIREKDHEWVRCSTQTSTDYWCLLKSYLRADSLARSTMNC